MRRRAAIICVIWGLGAVLSCTRGGSTPVVNTSVPSSTGTMDIKRPETADCRPGSPILPYRQGAEVQGISRNAQLWVLTSKLPLHPGPSKFVWRMTGESNKFVIVALNDRGMHAVVSQGPQHHESSTWDRPGEEWGSVLDLPTGGCWRFHTQRGTATGDVYLDVSS